MSIVRMIHPQHGAMHAYDTGEVARLRGFGWTPEDEVKPEKVGDDHLSLVHEAIASTFPPIAETPFKRKPGRPPKAK